MQNLYEQLMKSVHTLNELYNGGILPRFADYTYGMIAPNFSKLYLLNMKLDSIKQ